MGCLVVSAEYLVYDWGNELRCDGSFLWTLQRNEQTPASDWTPVADGEGSLCIHAWSQPRLGSLQVFTRRLSRHRA